MRRSRQSGQALAEAMVVLALFLALGMAVSGVGDLQWQGLSAMHASREQAFSYARGQRHAVVPSLRVIRAAQPAGFMAPGGNGIAAGALRRDWHIEDAGMVTAWARYAVRRQIPGASVQTLYRQTSVLADAGHASDDGQAQRAIGNSGTAWGRAAHASMRAGRQAAAALRGVDAGWRRPAPDFDWLMRWADLSPTARLRGGNMTSMRALP